MRLSVLSPSGEGRLFVPESPPLRVVWEKDVCLSVEAPPTRRVCGQVESHIGVVQRVWVSAGELATGVIPNRRAINVTRAGSWDPEAPGPALRLPSARQGGVGLIATPVEGGLLRVEGTMVGMPAHTAGLLPGELVRVSSADLGDVGGVVHIERVLTGESVSLHRALFDAPPGIPQLQDINGAPFVGFWSPQGALAL
ncbi:hypothetical protein L6R46_25280 [Myxococcota bacterium]|nr:hypothetical protein [Myxococcota bacterium]